MLGLCGSSLCNRKARRAVEPVEPVEAVGPEEPVEPVRPVRPVRGVEGIMLFSMKQRLESSTSGRHWSEL